MSLRGDVCVVSGACGFVGRRLVRLLLEEEEEVAEIRLLDKHVPSQYLPSLDDCRGDTKVSVFEGDIRDGEYMREVCRGATVVFHLASIIDVNDSVEYNEIYGINVTGTQLLLDACFNECVSSFVYVSTVEVMGPNRGEPVVNGSEDTVYRCSLKFNYSKTKKEAELRTLRAHGEELPNGKRLATCSLRPMYIYGEGCRFLLGHMADGVRNSDVLFRMSLPEALVNPVYVGNVAVALLQAARSLQDPLKRDHVGGKFYFISDDTPAISYSDFNHTVMAPLGFNIRDKLPLPLFLFYVLCFLMETLCWMLRPFVRLVPPLNRQLLTMLNTPFSFSYQKARRELGYEPRFSWEQARRGTTRWLASQLPAQREKIWSK